ncbi:MAG: glycosyltransferase family 4 protein [Candidatus Kerfeldbacteria bacterium]
MKILIVNYEFPPLGGGGGVAAKDLARGFMKNGHSVDYLTTRFKDARRTETVDGIRVHRVRVLGRRHQSHASLPSLLSFPFCALWKGIRLCRTHRYDLINTHFVIPSGPLGWLLSVLFRIPNILTVHGGDIYDPTKSLSPHRHWGLRAVVRFLLNRADVVTAQSSNTKENTLEYYRPRKQIQVIPLAYETIPYAPVPRTELELDPKAFVLAGMGRMVKRKRFADIVRALQLLPEQVRAVIIGKGPESEAIKSLAREMDVADRLLLPGFVSQERKMQLLNASDAFVLSSEHEGFGIVLQEAMQAGLPIIATNNGGQTDLITQSKNGYLYKPGDVQALVESIRALMANADLRREMAEENKQRVREFSPESIAQRYLELLG